MTRRSTLLQTLALACLACTGTGAAADQPPSAEYWPRVAYAAFRTCEVEVRGWRDRLFTISLTGLGPEEEFDFALINADRVNTYENKADKDGNWSFVLTPILNDSSTGVVYANIQSKSCLLSFSFHWERNIFLGER